MKPALACVAGGVALAQHVFAGHSATANVAVFRIGFARIARRAGETGLASGIRAGFSESHSWPACGKVGGPNLAGGVGTAISIGPTAVVDFATRIGGHTRSEATVGDTRKTGTPLRRAPPVDRAGITSGGTIRNFAMSRCTFAVLCAWSLQGLCAAKNGITSRPGTCDQTRRCLPIGVTSSCGLLVIDDSSRFNVQGKLGYSVVARVEKDRAAVGLTEALPAADPMGAYGVDVTVEKIDGGSTARNTASIDSALRMALALASCVR